MSKDFEITDEIILDATPEQVWEAIATGPGVDSWFMGRTEIEPGEGGTSSLDMTDAMGFVQKSAITAWEPARRLAFREDGPDGAFGAFEYLLEGRDGGSTVLRFVHNGVLAGDDWDEEYFESMRAGDLMFLRQLAAYVKHFPGRHASSNLFLVGPAVPDSERVWSRFADALSLSEIAEGAPVRLNVPGLPATEGVVEFLGAPYFVGVRTPHGIHLLVKGYRNVLVVGYHGFSEDGKDIAQAWRSWLASA